MCKSLKLFVTSLCNLLFVDINKVKITSSWEIEFYYVNIKIRVKFSKFRRNGYSFMISVQHLSEEFNKYNSYSFDFEELPFIVNQIISFDKREIEVDPTFEALDDLFRNKLNINLNYSNLNFY